MARTSVRESRFATPQPTRSDRPFPGSSIGTATPRQPEPTWRRTQSPNPCRTSPQFDMQCVDCHNRPTHAFELPERAVNRALASGALSSTLPYIRKKSVELLRSEYGGSEEAAQKIRTALVGFYREKYPDVYTQRSLDITRAADSVVSFYNRNVFPDLKVTWGTYANNLGHIDFPGCFRCHDEAHATSGKKTITQDCAVCHNALAVDEAAPEVLKTLGLTKP